MSLQKERDAGIPQSNKQGLVWSARNLTMQCANPQCMRELLYLREGRLELLELELHTGDQSSDDGAFAMRPLPSRCFWLCGECAKTYIVKRWTPSGLVVVLRNEKPADPQPDLAAHPANTGTTPLIPSLPVVPPTRAGQATAPSGRLASVAEKVLGPKARPPKDHRVPTVPCS